MREDIIAYLYYSEKIDKKEKSELLKILQPPLWEKIKWLLWLQWAKDQIESTQADILDILYQLIEVGEDESQIVAEYESYNLYKEEMKKQAALWPVEFDTIEIADLSKRTKNTIEQYAVRYYLPLCHLELMAWITKKYSKSNSSGKFIEYLSWLQTIAKNSPSLWIDVVKLYVLSYASGNNWSALYNKIFEIVVSNETPNAKQLIAEHIEFLEEIQKKSQEDKK